MEHDRVLHLLLQHGSSLWKRDREGLTPLDIVMKDRMPHIEFLHTGISSVTISDVKDCPLKDKDRD